MTPRSGAVSDLGHSGNCCINHMDRVYIFLYVVSSKRQPRVLLLKSPFTVRFNKADKMSKLENDPDERMMKIGNRLHTV